METEPLREPLAEIPLSGGRLTPGIVRVGSTVRRPAKGNDVRGLWLGWSYCPCQRFRGRLTTGVTQSWAGRPHRRHQDLCRRSRLDASAGARVAAAVPV